MPPWCPGRASRRGAARRPRAGRRAELRAPDRDRRDVHDAPRAGGRGAVEHVARAAHGDADVVLHRAEVGDDRRGVDDQLAVAASAAATAAASVVSHSAELGARRGRRARRPTRSMSSPSTPRRSAASRLHSAPPMKPPAPVTATRVSSEVHGRTYTRVALRTSRAIRATAWAVVAAGVAAPLIRRRARLPAPAVIAHRGRRPVRAVRRRRARSRRARRRHLRAADVGVRRRLPDAPRRSGGARAPRPHRLPGARGHRARPRPAAHAAPAAPLAEPRPLHAASTRCSCGRTGCGSSCPTRRWPTCCFAIASQFPRAAVLTYAVFDLGAVVYWSVPTAPPWYAARHGRMVRCPTCRACAA